jgi:DNA gyrase subunit B/topoisomerase-4 subunit B
MATAKRATARGGSYSASDIQVLEGLEPVRKRPAMYIGGTDVTGYHHLLWEIVDNSVDEVINGYADRVEVTLHKDGKSVTVTDDGRGIPVDVHPRYRKPALEIILTTLHSGGKFDQGNYLHSGGLHGVGSSVVNALSSKLTAEVRRESKKWVQSFSRGKPTSKLKSIGPARGTGTAITFTPDTDIFGEKVGFDPELIRERLEAKSYLHKGMEVVFRDQTASPATEVHYRHDGGIAEYLGKVVAERSKALVPAGADPFYVSAEDPRLELAVAWTEATDEHVRSYVNGIPTNNGGTHEAGLRSGLGEGSPELHRDPRADAQGSHAHRGGHPGGDGGPSSPPTSSSPSSRGRPRGASTTRRWPVWWTTRSGRRWRSGSTTISRSPSPSSPASRSLPGRGRRAGRPRRR